MPPCESELSPLDRIRAIAEMFQQAADELLIPEFGLSTTLPERIAHELYNGMMALYGATLESLYAQSADPIDGLTGVMAGWISERRDPLTGGTVGQTAAEPLPAKSFNAARN